MLQILWFSWFCKDRLLREIWENDHQRTIVMAGHLVCESTAYNFDGTWRSETWTISGTPHISGARSTGYCSRLSVNRMFSVSVCRNSAYENNSAHNHNNFSLAGALPRSEDNWQRIQDNRVLQSWWHNTGWQHFKHAYYGRDYWQKDENCNPFARGQWWRSTLIPSVDFLLSQFRHTSIMRIGVKEEKRGSLK